MKNVIPYLVCASQLLLTNATVIAAIEVAPPENRSVVSPDFRRILNTPNQYNIAKPNDPQLGNAAVGMVVGDTPGEVLVVSGLEVIQGDLQIIGDGRVEIAPTGTLRINGDIHLVGDGQLVGNAGRLEFLQTYSYESEILVWEQSSIELHGTVIDGGGHSFSMAIGAKAVWFDVEVVNGFATWALFDGGDVELSNITNAGEFLQIGTSSLLLYRCETVLFWLTLPDGSIVDTTLPSPGDVAIFELNSKSSWASGIPYTTRIEECTQSMWAIMARDGSDATIRDSELRVVGNIFESNDSFEISGVANGMHIADSTFIWGGVQQRFVNSTVQTWNYYAWGQTILTMRNTIFGEVFSDDLAVVTVEQSICDGSGGHMHTNGQGQLFFLQSLCLTQITIEDNSLFVGASSSFMSPVIDATGDSISAFYNSTTTGDPRAHDSAAIFIAALNPLTATRGDIVPVSGSARMITGPQSFFEFVSFDVEFLDDPDWIMIDGPVPTPVNNGALAQWDTAAVLPGQHTTRLSMIHSGGGDPIQLQSTATINAPLCPADLTADGILDFFDISGFLTAFSAGIPAADFTGDGIFDFFDISAFLTAFSAGCP